MDYVSEVRGVTLKYVTREVEGDIIARNTRFNKEEGNIHVEVKVKDPVIVFFPNNSSQVMSKQLANSKGFLDAPEVLNLAAVDDHSTPAGRFKHAIRDSDRKEAWLDMENSIINGCIASTGHPLPRNATYKMESIYLD